ETHRPWEVIPAELATEPQACGWRPLFLPEGGWTHQCLATGRDRSLHDGLLSWWQPFDRGEPAREGSDLRYRRSERLSPDHRVSSETDGLMTLLDEPPISYVELVARRTI